MAQNFIAHEPSKLSNLMVICIQNLLVIIDFITYVSPNLIL